MGHLGAVKTNENFGFQSTVFRLAGDPSMEGGSRVEKVSFGTQQLFMSHAALSQLNMGEYLNVERIYREGWQARSKVGSMDLQAGTIRARQLEGREVFEMVFFLPGGIKVELVMTPQKPLVSFGERGLSRKGSDPAAVSLYWTYTRLDVRGTILRDGKEIEVEGVAWQDHEISSSQLGSNLVGWDWTCMQLDDGTEVKAYRLRQSDGASDPWSAVYWIDKSADIRWVYADEFEWIEDAYWKSRKTGVRYPTSVTVRARDPKRGEWRIYRLRPLLNDQEFVGNRRANPYWEGACEVLDGKGKRIGKAYLELAGYGGGLANQLN